MTNTTPAEADVAPAKKPARKKPAKRAPRKAAAAQPLVEGPGPEVMHYADPVDPEATREVVYVGLACEVTLPTLGYLVAVRGVPVAVPASAVGTAPSGTPGDDDYEPGEGLLAQVENWALPGSKAAKHAPPPQDTPWTDEAAASAANASA